MTKEDIKEYIYNKIGKEWFKNVTDNQIYHFIEWAMKCQTFVLNNNICDAFRGFVKGIEYLPHKNKIIDESEEKFKEIIDMIWKLDDEKLLHIECVVNARMRNRLIELSKKEKQND